MRISRNIGHSPLEQLMLISDFIDKFDSAQLLHAIEKKRFDQDDIISITEDIKIQNSKLCKQKISLNRMSISYNKKFATDNNGVFDTARKTSLKIKSGIKGIKDIFKNFTPRVNKRQANGPQEGQAILHSAISSSVYQLELFGFDSYPDCVKVLLKEMLNFFNNLNDCLRICREVIDEERDLKKDGKRCLDLFMKACEKALERQQYIIDALNNDPALLKAMMNNDEITGDSENGILRKYHQHKDDETRFAQNYMHCFCPVEINKLMVNKGIEAACSGDITPNEELLFGHNKKSHIMDIRYVIENFDILIANVKCKRNYIPARELLVFMNWCGTNGTQNLFCTYFTKLYVAANGKWNVPGASALSGKNKLLTPGQLDAYVEKMDLDIKGLLEERDRKVKVMGRA